MALDPTALVSYAVLVVVVEALSWVVIRVLTPPGLSRKFLSITIMSFASAFLIVFFLAPNGAGGWSFDQVFVVLWIIHLVGFLAASRVNSGNRKGNR